MDRFSRWAEKEYGIEHRITATLIAGILFVILIPLFIVKASSALDNWLGIPRFELGLVNTVIGGILTLVGLVFALWSIITQLTLGRGSPLPIMATQKLLITGPFRYSRNPMSFGAILIYLGVAVLIGSISAIVIVLVISVALIVYLKRIEESELEQRFGEDYVEYKKRTPFLIPRAVRDRSGEQAGD